jgi:hypothetical protein
MNFFQRIPTVPHPPGNDVEHNVDLCRNHLLCLKSEQLKVANMDQGIATSGPAKCHEFHFPGPLPDIIQD